MAQPGNIDTGIQAVLTHLIQSQGKWNTPRDVQVRPLLVLLSAVWQCAYAENKLNLKFAQPIETKLTCISSR